MNTPTIPNGGLARPNGASERPGRSFILTLSCPNRIGIVYAVSKLLYEQNCNITDSAQFDDLVTDRFFMRVAFTALNAPLDRKLLEQHFSSLSEGLQMDWALVDCAERQRVVLLLSKFDHCLADLLYRHNIGELNIDIPVIISNHPNSRELAQNYGIPFVHLPVTQATKIEQEARLLDELMKAKADLIVLARYMQILSTDLCQRLPCPAINIHHSFLPSFKGAKPYHQAHARGVKVIGATAHYVTPDLDEGPIIEQGVERVSHALSPEALVTVGRDVEKVTLARAVKLHIERRILLNGIKTVVFS